MSPLLTPPLSNYRWPVDTLVTTAVERTVQAIDRDRRFRRMLLTPIAQPLGSVGPPRAG